jgi:hypothetical protein
MSEIIDRESCVLETIMAANGNEDGLGTEASKVLGIMVAEAEVDGAQLIIDCAKCDTRFAISRHDADFTPVTLASEKDCQQPLGIVGDETGDWQLNINVRKMRERGDIQ